MRSSRFVLAILFAALGPTACGSCDDKPKENGATDSGTAAVTTDAAPSTSASATIGKRNMRERGAPGPVGMLAGAARSLELKDEQKTKLDAAEKSLKGDDASARDEIKALHTDLAASVKAGKLDQTKIDADLAALEKAAKDRSDKEAAALNDVYAALEPAQRTQVVAKVRERTEKREKQMSERMAKMAEKADGGAGADGGAAGGRGAWGSEFTAQKRMERMTKDLDLDAEQQKKAQAAAKDDPKAPTMETARAEAKKRGEALLAAFEKDGFDAKKLEAPDTKRARQGAEQEVKLISALLPILKPEQREKLAARIEKQAQGHGGPGGPGGPGGAHAGMLGMPGGPGGPGGRGGHRRGPGGRHGAQAMGPDYDWFDDDEEEEMAGGAGGAATPSSAGAPSAAPSGAASAPAK